MKLDEIYRGGVTDNEDLGEHARKAVTVSFDVNFAHEPGQEEMFSQLLSSAAYQEKLSAAFARVMHTTMQEMVRTAKGVPPGHGWTDDFEVQASVASRESNTI